MADRALRTTTLAVILLILTILSASAAIDVLDAFYRPDRMLPEYNCLWPDDGHCKPGDPNPIISASGALCIYVKNSGTGDVTISDILLQNVSMTNAMACRPDDTYRAGTVWACSIHCGSAYCPPEPPPAPTRTPISDTERFTLINAGEPVWWRVDPLYNANDPDSNDHKYIPAGGTAEVFIRMRTRVATTLSLTIVTSVGNVSTSIVVSDTVPPRVAGYGLSSDSKTPNPPSPPSKLYLYLRHPQKGTLPTKVFVDGVEKPFICPISVDTDIDIVPVVCDLESAFTRGSFHCFQAVYGDGSKASMGLRVYYDDFQYGRYGGAKASTNQEKHDALVDMARHSMNLQVWNAADLGSYMGTIPGQALMAELGIWWCHITTVPTRSWGYYLSDEPDCGEVNVPLQVCSLKDNQPGTLAQSLVVRVAQHRDHHADLVNHVNVNGTFKPYDWYHYGHVADTMASDPYYQVRQATANFEKPWTMPLYAKATYIYAVSSTINAACEPRPSHIALLSCGGGAESGYGSAYYRWPTPVEKRIEAYYVIAGGGRQISYWWFTPSDIGANGMGASEPGAVALWREVGLVGAELGTAGPVIVNSCPAQMPITSSPKVWVRGLVSGVNTIMLVCVNDDYANTNVGTIIRPVNDAKVSLDLPSWLTSPTDVFEVDYKGVRDISKTIVDGKVTVDLGTVNVTRMIIITKDTNLKSTLQTLYTSKYGPRVAELIPAL